MFNCGDIKTLESLDIDKKRDMIKTGYLTTVNELKSRQKYITKHGGFPKELFIRSFELRYEDVADNDKWIYRSPAYSLHSNSITYKNNVPKERTSW